MISMQRSFQEQPVQHASSSSPDMAGIRELFAPKKLSAPKEPSTLKELPASKEPSASKEFPAPEEACAPIE